MDSYLSNLILLALLSALYAALASWFHFHKRKLTLDIALEYILIALIVWFLTSSLV